MRPELIEAEIMLATMRRPISRRRIVAVSAGVLIALLIVIAAQQVLRRLGQEGRIPSLRAAEVPVDATTRSARIEEGEASIFCPEDGKYVLAARPQMADWPRIAAAGM